MMSQSQMYDTVHDKSEKLLLVTNFFMNGLTFPIFSKKVVE